jgi:hypothetical protein
MNKVARDRIDHDMIRGSRSDADDSLGEDSGSSSC